MRIYYVDETGIDKYLCREKERAPRGVRLYSETRGKKFRRKSIVAGKCGQRIVTPLVYSGTMDGALFEFWSENCLMKEIEKDSVVIMDNAATHKRARLLR